MHYKDENRFTQDERDAIDGLARVVALVCRLDVEELRGKSRKRHVADARKIACKYTYDNIPNSKFMVGRNLSLSAWYFNLDHSTVSHAVHTADHLYDYDPEFAKIYDTVVEIIDNPNYKPDLEYHKIMSNKKTWDDVRMDEREYNKTKYSLLPESVKEEIINIYKKGYGMLHISNKVGTTLDFVEYLIKKEGVKKDKVGDIKRALNSESVKFGVSTSIAY
jgi:hypothetical protein